MIYQKRIDVKVIDLIKIFLSSNEEYEVLVRRARMIDLRLAKLEGLMDGILKKLNEERAALISIRTWLEAVDRDAEVIPDTDSKRLTKLLQVLKGEELSTVEKKVVNQLFHLSNHKKYGTINNV